MIKLVVTTCINFIFFSGLFAQILIGEFTNSFSGQFLTDESIILACNDCTDISQNTIAFYQYDGSGWALFDSFTTSTYYPNLFIDRIDVSKDLSTVSVIMNDPNNTLVNDNDDVFLIFRKNIGSWGLIYSRENIIGNYSGNSNVFNSSLSESGNDLIISYSNVEPGTSGIASKITIEILRYSDNKYNIIQTLAEDIISRDRFYMNYLYKSNEILIHSGLGSFPSGEIFHRFALINGTWVKLDNFIEEKDNEFDFAHLSSDYVDDSFLLTKAYSSNADNKLTIIESLVNNGNSEFERTIIYDRIDLNFYLNFISTSDNLKTISLNYVANTFSQTDTSTFIDYLKLENGLLKKVQTFSFPLESTPNFFGDIGGGQISPNGNKILFHRGLGTQVYDMSDFLSNTSSISEDDEYQHQNLTGSTIDLRQVEDLKIYNTIGQLLIETTTESIDLSAMPSGMYILHYLKNGYVTHVRKVMKF